MLLYGEGFWENSRKDASVPGVVRQDGLVVVLQEAPHLVQDVEPPVVQDLRQVGHTAHVHPLSCHKENTIVIKARSETCCLAEH